MPGQLRWILVFMDSTLDHLAERDITADDVADAVFGRHGVARVRRTGKGDNLRWFVVAPVEGDVMLTCILRAARDRDLTAPGSFQVPPAASPEEPQELKPSMRVCVSARVSDDDEVRAYRAWGRKKGSKS
jgi:hypothetical protein